MSDKAKILEGLQVIVTDLEQQAAGHAIQSANEERGYVVKCIDRILDLGGTVRNEAKKEAPVFADALEFVKYDLQVSRDGLAWLAGLVEEARADYSTFDILKEYYQDEEEDMYWAAGQLELVKLIGKENWYIQQL